MFLGNNAYLSLKGFVQKFRIPAHIDASVSFLLREGLYVVAVLSVNRYSSSLGDVACYLITGNRRTALGKPYHKVIHALNHNTGFAIGPFFLKPSAGLLAYYV